MLSYGGVGPNLRAIISYNDKTGKEGGFHEKSQCNHDGVDDCWSFCVY